MKVDINLEGLGKVIQNIENLKTNVIKKAIAATLNECGEKGRSIASETIREEYNIKAKDVKGFLTVKKASSQNLEVVITGKGKGVPLVKFNARQEGVTLKGGLSRYTKRAKRSGNFRRGGAVTVLVKTAGGRKTVHTDPKPFIAKIKGELQVLQRIGKSREKLRRLLGPGIALLFGSKKINDVVIARGKAHWKERLLHNIKYFQNK
jgi:hypothetical protein